LVIHVTSILLTGFEVTVQGHNAVLWLCP